MPKESAATNDARTERGAPVRCDDLLAELDRLYIKFRATQQTAVWGGSWEREHAAQMDLKPLVNAMFNTMIKLLEARSANDQAERP